jgi:Smg protein
MMMDILMYLFETYIHSDAELQVNQDELEEELLRAGFHQDDIYKALIWLEDLAALQQSETHAAISVCSTSTSTRIYTKQECERLSLECRGFITFLEQVNVLTTETREMVIDRVMGLETEEFELDDLKWIILMVLFNVPGNENAYTLMEELLYTKEQGILH